MILGNFLNTLTLSNVETVIGGGLTDKVVLSGAYTGGTIEPVPDFAKLAETVGGYGENVTRTEDVLPALQRGLDMVRNGTPAIVAVRVP